MDLVMIAESTIARFLGVLASSVLLAFLPPVRKQLVPRLVKLSRNWPNPLRTGAVWLADFAWPDWRTYGGGSRRDRVGTVGRLLHVRRGRGWPPVLLFGATYLDVSVGPIRMRRLRAGEISSLDAVSIELGGSGPYLGKHLHQFYDVRSRLYTRIGGSDPLSGQLRQLLKEQRWRRGWPLGKYAHLSKGEQCGVSVHLQQNEDVFHSTFTHTGALGSLTWNQHLFAIQKASRRGGILYVSGFFRTNLQAHLCSSLRKLSPKLLIVFDHGRFEPQHSERGVTTLSNAFSQGLIDVYVCTFSELEDLCQGMNLIEDDEHLRPKELVERVSTNHRLFPRLVLVRGNSLDEHTDAYALWDGVAIQASVEARRSSATGDRPGEKTAFTAGFLASIADAKDAGGNVVHVITDALDDAVARWADGSK